MLKPIPSHWEVLRAKLLFREIDDRTVTGDETLLSVSHKTGVTPRSEKNVTMFMAESYTGHKAVQPGDLVINTMWAWMAAVGVAFQPGLVSPSYGVYRPRPGVALVPRYFDYLSRIETYRVEYFRESRGITTSRLRLYPDDFLRIPFLVPPVDEQTAIVRFVQNLDLRVNRLLSSKRKLLELLDEQAFILTLRGTSADLKAHKGMLLGEVPASWSCKPAKRIFEEIRITNKPQDQLLAVTQDRGVLPKSLCEQNYVSPAGDLGGLKLVSEDDFVISLRSFQGGIEHSTYRGIVSPAYTVIRLRPSFNSPENIRYFRYLLKSPMFIGLLNTVISGIRDGKNVNFYDFGELVLPVPTREDVVEMIPAFDRLDAARAHFAAVRKLIAEYRDRLVSEVVTGQIDVSHLNIEEVDLLEIESNELDLDVGDEEAEMLEAV